MPDLIYPKFDVGGTDVTMLANIAVEDLKNGRVSRAEWYVKQALLISPSNYLARLTYAKVLQDQENSLLAYQLFDEIAKDFPNDTEALDCQAWIAYTTGHMDLCLQHIENAFGRGMPPRHHLIGWANDAARRIGAFDRFYSILDKCPAVEFFESYRVGAELAERAWNEALATIENTDGVYQIELSDVKRIIDEGKIDLASNFFKILLLKSSVPKKDLLQMTHIAYALPDGSGLSNYVAAVAFSRYPMDIETRFSYAIKLSMVRSSTAAGRLLLQIIPETPQPDVTLRLLTFICATGGITPAQLTTAALNLWNRIADVGVIQHAISFVSRSSAAAAPCVNNQMTFDFESSDHNRLNQVRSDFSRRSLRQRQLKLAVCVSGQLRSFRKSWPSTRIAIDQFDTTVFVATWENTGAGIGVHDTISRILPKSIDRSLPPDLKTKRFFSSNFPSCWALFQAEETVGKSDLENHFQTEQISIFNESEFNEKHRESKGIYSNGNLNQAKMFFLLHEVNNMTSAYSNKLNYDFDLILRIRPDRMLSHLSQSDIDEALKNFVICSDYYISGGVGDQFFISNPKIADIYSQIWPNLERAGAPTFFPGSSGRFNEFLMAEWLEFNGVGFSRFKSTKHQTFVSVEIDLQRLWSAMMVDLSHGAISSEQRAVAKTVWNIYRESIDRQAALEATEIMRIDLRDALLL